MTTTLSSFESKDALLDPTRGLKIYNEGNLHTLSDLWRRRLRSFALQISIIVLPFVLVSAELIALIFLHRIPTEASLFPQKDSEIEKRTNAYIFVSYSSNWLLVLASYASMAAPICGGIFISRWSRRIVKELRLSSQQPAFEPAHLFRYFGQIFKAGSKVEDVHRKLKTIILGLILLYAVFTAPAVIFRTSRFYGRVALDLPTIRPSPALDFGRGIPDTCLHFSRISNQGFPCTYIHNLDLPPGDVKLPAANQNEAYDLQRNSSLRSQIRLVPRSSANEPTVAILLPKPETVPSNIDYAASTIGISTRCETITSRCNMTTRETDSSYSHFDCSDKFWGSLGKPPNTSVMGKLKTYDPDVPPMSFKPSSNLQYAFFRDHELDEIYNTGQFDVETGEFDERRSFISDSDLINPAYITVAGRMTNDSTEWTPDIEYGLPRHQDANFVLNCAFTTYNVYYTWNNGSLGDTDFRASVDGSLAEMYHGLPFVWLPSLGVPSLAQVGEHNGFRAMGDDFANQWADSYSEHVLSLLGAYTSPTANLLEQERERTKLMKVSTPWLGILQLLNLVSFFILAFLVRSAYKTSVLDENALLIQSTPLGYLARTLRFHLLSAAILSDCRDKTIVGSAANQKKLSNTPLGVDGLFDKGYMSRPSKSSASKQFLKQITGYLRQYLAYVRNKISEISSSRDPEWDEHRKGETKRWGGIAQQSSLSRLDPHSAQNLSAEIVASTAKQLVQEWREHRYQSCKGATSWDIQFRGTDEGFQNEKGNAVTRSSPRKHTVADRSKKRQRSNSDGGEDTDGDNEPNDPSKKPRHIDTNELCNRRLLRCPFNAFNPQRYSERNHVEMEYRHCSSCVLTTIPRLKQHLYRVHRRPDHYCARCFEIFSCKNLLDSHTRQASRCQILSSPFEDRITEAQLAQVRQRKPGRGISGNWYHIYQVLFPAATKPHSPYVDDNNVVQEFLRDFGAKASRLLESRLSDADFLRPDSGSVAIEEVLEKAIEEILIDFHNFKRIQDIPRLADSQQPEHEPAASKAEPEVFQEFTVPTFKAATELTPMTTPAQQISIAAGCSDDRPQYVCISPLRSSMQLPNGFAYKTNGRSPPLQITRIDPWTNSSLSGSEGFSIEQTHESEPSQEHSISEFEDGIQQLPDDCFLPELGTEHQSRSSCHTEGVDYPLFALDWEQPGSEDIPSMIWDDMTDNQDLGPNT